MNHSHIFTGNTQRFHKLFHKLKNGEPISLVFLGASITLAFRIENQHQFSTIMAKHLEEKYENSNIVCHNLSEAGMPSLHGLYLSYFELEKYSPDLVVIDYSINDQKSPAFRDGFESLIVKCLNTSSKPAVCTFFVKALAGYTCAPQMSAVCEHYQVPYVNIGTWLDEDIQRGCLRWENYSYDDRHPGPFGHGYIGTCMTKFLDILAQTQAVPETFPDTGLFNNELANLRFPFDSTDDFIALPQEFDAVCSTLFLRYIVDTCDNYGCIDIIVDGKIVQTLNSFRIHEWRHATQEVIYLSKETSAHHISIKKHKGSKDKLFHLLCVGYC